MTKNEEVTKLAAELSTLPPAVVKAIGDYLAKVDEKNAKLIKQNRAYLDLCHSITRYGTPDRGAWQIITLIQEAVKTIEEMP